MSEYWPEFGKHGKSDVTVRELLDHKVGIAGPDPPIGLDTLEDVQATNEFLANTKMEWDTPGDRSGYMAILLGNYMSALIQKTTDHHQTMGQYLREEICKPLGIEDEFYLGLPKEIPDSRLATIDAKRGFEALQGGNCGTCPRGFIKKLILDRKSYVARAFNNPRLSDNICLMDFDQRRVREIELPGSNGQATARAIAKIYSTVERAINSKANPLDFTKESLDALQQPAQPNRITGWYDEILMIEICLSLGMAKPAPDELCKDNSDPTKGARFWNFGSDHRAFGTNGAGGSFAFCDPNSGLAFSYTPNRAAGDCILDDPREFALRSKAYACARALQSADEAPLPMQRLSTQHYLVTELFRKYPFLAPLKEED